MNLRTPFHPRSSRRRPRVAASIAALLLAATLAACGNEIDAPGADPSATPAAASAESLTVEDPWVRSTDGAEDTSMTGAFMVLDNTGDEELTVTGASSDVAKKVELHEMAMVDGASVMREIDGGIVLAAGKGQLLQPGGMHVMLMGLTEELPAGAEVDLVLELADGSTLEVNAPVKAFTEEDEHYHAPGTGDHEH